MRKNKYIDLWSHSGPDYDKHVENECVWHRWGFVDICFCPRESNEEEE